MAFTKKNRPFGRFSAVDPHHRLTFDIIRQRLASHDVCTDLAEKCLKCHFMNKIRIICEFRIVKVVGDSFLLFVTRCLSLLVGRPVGLVPGD